MIDIGPFGNALEAIENLPQDQQEELVAIVRKRLRERKREALIADVLEAQAEFARGEGRVMSASELVDLVLNEVE